MRPIRVTGVTGTSPPVPLDVYAVNAQTLCTLSGAGALTFTIDNVFDPTITPAYHAAPIAINAVYTIPVGARAVQATGMAPADVLVVSQQGII